MNEPSHSHRVDLDALQARVALRLSARLGESANTLPHDISERLRVAREQAVLRARRVRLAAPAGAAAVFHSSQGNATLGQPTPWWLRFASVAPLVMLVLGLVLIQQLHDQAQIRAAAEVDAALLADDLPPAAYGDPGFGEFLKQPEP